MPQRIPGGLTVLLLAACSSTATGPDGGGGGPGSHRVVLSVNNVTVRGTCDEFPIDADGGEWSYKLTARFPDGGTLTLGSTSSYPSPSSKRNVKVGGQLPINADNQTIDRIIADQAGNAITLTIAATEWDYDIFGGNPGPDARMDNRSATATFAFKDGAWPTAPAGVLALKSTNACWVDVNYSLDASAVP